ncbi:MAG: efflux RND transporter periplasmic adaptor subunit [Candidatus Nealsonbacteria bacterium]|nr:efflux RND transporter periplasmic adaptor subunit [Candidatus Nealsonbacteria bacterium]
MRLETATKFKAAIGILLKRVLPVIVGLTFLILVIAWLAGVMVEKIEPGPSEAVVRRVDPNQQQGVYEVSEVFKDYVAEAVGTLRAASRTEISSRVLASINTIGVHAGQTVAAGDVLITLDRRTLEAQLGKAQASLVAVQATREEAEVAYRRAAELFQKNVTSQAAMDQRTARLRVARAQSTQAQQTVSEANVMLSYATIKAPKDGMIVDRLAEPGDMARPGEPLLVLYDPTSLRLEVPVMENLAVNLKSGDELPVQIDALDNRQVAAVIDEIVPQAEAVSRSFLVKVRLPRSEDLFEGMFGRLIIPVGTRRHLCLHTGAIETIGQLQFVDVVASDGVVERRFIKTGRYGDAIHREVLSGLEAGDRVLLKPGTDPGAER